MLLNPSQGVLIAGRFVLEKEVGAGGMGTVYRGWDQQARGPVAVKLLRTEETVDRERFKREVAVLAALSHPGIVRYLSHGVLPDGTPFIVMEWVEGESLAARLADPGLTVGESVAVVRALAEALGEVHRQGVVHRDLKPGNILFEERSLERVKLIDFGIARSNRPLQNLTRSGFVVGTPGYMAPEQARGERNIAAPADVFALGCVLYHCLTGRPPFSGEHLTAVRTKVLLGAPVAIHRLCPDVPCELEALVDRMLAKEPAARPPDAHAVALELAALAALGPIGSSERRSSPSAWPATPVGKRLAPASESAGRLVSVVLLGPAEDDQGELPPAPDAEELALSSELARFSAGVERLADGAVVVLVAGSAAGAEPVARAARAALALRRRFPERPLVVVTGREGEGGPPVADAVMDTAAERLERLELERIFRAAGPAATAIRLDTITAKLLEPAFAVEADSQGAFLRSATR